MLILLLLLTLCAAAAFADTEYALAPCSGKLSLDENTYIVLTPDNLDDHPELLSSIGKSKEDLLADWTKRGVQLQAWTKKMNSCLEVTVIQDDEAKQYYDLEQLTKQVRMLRKRTGRQHNESIFIKGHPAGHGFQRVFRFSSSAGTERRQQQDQEQE